MNAETEARVLAEFGASQGADIIALARSFMGRADPPPKPAPPREVVVDVHARDARMATGTANPAVSAKLLREACAGLDEAGARATVELLKQFAPRDVREALTIRRLVALDALAMETLALARAAPHPLLRDAYVAQACALSRASTALDEALERKRSGGAGQRVVMVQHIKGGQVVGMVNQDISRRADAGQSPPP
jgi:hypothetical protein